MRRKVVGDGGEGQVMGRDEPDGAALEEAPQHADRAEEAVVRVRAVKKLVEQEQQRPALREVRETPQAGEFRGEARSPFLQGGLEWQGGAGRGRRQLPPPGGRRRAL